LAANRRPASLKTEGEGMATTGIGACEAIRAHHQALREGLTERADAVSISAAAGRAHEPAVAGFIAYMSEEVLPHAAAEEATIYPAVAAHTGLSDLVGEMITEHAFLSLSASRLATLTDRAAAAGQARQIAERFAAHAAKENDVLLPALLADHTVDLAELIGQMHDDLDRRISAGAAEADGGEDPQATVLSLLLQATGALARTGEADRACRIAASAWAAVRETRPELAASVATALHSLVRHAGSAVLVGTPDGAGCESPACSPDLDVRGLESGPRVWRVRIGRTPPSEVQ
jgi:iron-sulfur cluster repair protein YtfE (RIC family)